jgi:hypothetical protein
MFELHIKTTGWIALGISPGRLIRNGFRRWSLLINLAGGMRGADIGVGWVDRSGNIHFQVQNPWS